MKKQPCYGRQSLKWCGDNFLKGEIMKDLSKRLWTARLLALLVMSFGLSFLVHIAPESKFKKKVEIRANENVGEIVTAVEQLGRDDIYIKTKDETWAALKPGFFAIGVSLFLFFGIFLGFYHAIYCIISSLLNRIERDDNLLNPTL